MRNVPGLLLIDNIEEIDDPNVLDFIYYEVPDPVKVLVTSRIAKRIGASTISVPAMTIKEAEELLSSELNNFGINTSKADDPYFRDVLTSAGGVPLAIKWAAQITREKQSLREAAGVLKGLGSNKQEFLCFCFAKMFDTLSDTAKDVAKLIPYLEAEWTPLMISIALGLPADVVKMAIYEISDKGLIYPARGARAGGYIALPLTKDYLSGKLKSRGK